MDGKQKPDLMQLSADALSSWTPAEATACKCADLLSVGRNTGETMIRTGGENTENRL